MVEAAEMHQYCKVGGYNEVLESLVHVDIEGKIRVKELDLEQEAVLDFILRDIKREYKQGNLLSTTRYKGKHSKRWFNFGYPKILEPRLFGVFNKKAFLGWFSLLKSAIGEDWIQYGIILGKKYRGKGLGKSILRFVLESMKEIYSPPFNRIFVITRLDNKKMRGVAESLELSFLDDKKLHDEYIKEGSIVYIMKK